MGKYLNKDKKRSRKRLLVIAVVLVLVLILGLGAVLGLDRMFSDTPETGDDVTQEQTQQTSDGTDEAPATQPMENQPSATEPDTNQPSVTEPDTNQPTATEPEASRLPALEYPVVLEDGKLVIENLFQYDGANPDCDLEEDKNIACVVVKNVSGLYLENARLTLTLTDGTVVNCTVTELPAGKAAMAFATDNTAMKADALCAEATCVASWSDEITPVPDGVRVSVEDMLVTVTNNTGRDIPELIIYCRCLMGEEYFGGIAYQYTISNLSAHESADVEAWDCILGVAEVVRIVVNEE